MLTKTKNFIVFPKLKNVKKGTFFELARKNIIKSKKGLVETLSINVDSTVYGK